MKRVTRCSYYARVLYTVLVVVICICAQTTEPPEEEELKKMTVPELCDFLLKTEKKIVKEYSPKAKGEGEEVMTMFRRYNDALALIFKKAKAEMKQKEPVNTTLTEAQVILNHGPPKFINIYDVKRLELEKTFGMNNISSRVLFCQRQNTIDVWGEFVRLYKRLKQSKDDSDESLDKS